ncbi:MAG: hypothetical protein JXJ30_04795 [Halothiobacillaceae bacterium]|nr:hypothetical protein [Halothiobacillaceae bacterium]HER34030.1 hypothetical protein [Halothiobacillaceae bacterium]
MASAAFALAACLFAAAQVNAQAGTQDTSATAAAVHGLSQSQVIARYGEPLKRHAAVPAQGEPPKPPIIRWDYADFSIYFEKSIALHRVEHGKFPPQ